MKKGMIWRDQKIPRYSLGEDIMFFIPVLESIFLLSMPGSRDSSVRLSLVVQN